MLDYKTLALCVSTWICLSCFQALHGDEVTSKDGEILKGKVILQTTNAIVFKSPFIGEATILRSNIADLKIDETPEAAVVEQPGDVFNRQLEEIMAPIIKPGDHAYDWFSSHQESG